MEYNGYSNTLSQHIASGLSDEPYMLKDDDITNREAINGLGTIFASLSYANARYKPLLKDAPLSNRGFIGNPEVLLAN